MANPRAAVGPGQLNPVRHTWTADPTTLPYTAGTGPGTPFNHGTTKYNYLVTMLSSDTVGLPATTTVATIAGQLALIAIDGKCTVTIGPNLVNVPYYDGTHTNTVAINDRVVVDEYGLVKTDTTVKAGWKVTAINTTAKTVELVQG